MSNPNICPIAPNEILTALAKGKFKPMTPSQVMGYQGCDSEIPMIFEGDLYDVVLDQDIGEVQIHHHNIGVTWRLDIRVERLI